MTDPVCVNHFCRFERPELEAQLFDYKVANEHLRHVLKLYEETLEEIALQDGGDLAARGASLAAEALFEGTRALYGEPLPRDRPAK